MSKINKLKCGVFPWLFVFTVMTSCNFSFSEPLTIPYGVWLSRDTSMQLYILPEYRLLLGNQDWRLTFPAIYAVDGEVHNAFVIFESQYTRSEITSHSMSVAACPHKTLANFENFYVFWHSNTQNGFRIGNDGRLILRSRVADWQDGEWHGGWIETEITLILLEDYEPINLNDWTDMEEGLYTYFGSPYRRD